MRYYWVVVGASTRFPLSVGLTPPLRDRHALGWRNGLAGLAYYHIAGMTQVLLIPGLWNSGPDHWQSYWERDRADCRRVEQADWVTPRRDDWVAALDRAVAGAPGPVVLVAHSLGCATVAHWAATATPGKVRGALLVAPSDVDAPMYPPGTEGFRPMPLAPLLFPSIVVASRDDVWVSADHAAALARAWGSRFVDVGSLGHINADSQLGAWSEGQALLDTLIMGSTT